MERCEQLGIHDVQFHRIGIPDEYVHHGTQDVLRAQYDLHAEGIAKRVREFVGTRSGHLAETKGSRSFGEVLQELGRQIPDEDLIRMHDKEHDSEHLDEVVYGTGRRVAK
jgi:hypothetical protein